MRRLALLSAFALAACGGPTTPPAKTPADFPLWGWVTGGAALYGSADDGQTWTSLTEEPVRALGAAKVGGRVVVVSKQGGVSTSDDGGKTWASSSLSGVPASGAWSFFAGAANLYVGAAGLVFKSTDRGATWTSSGTGLPQGGSPAKVEALAEVGSSLVVVPSLSGVYRSTDGGQTFFISQTGIPVSVTANAVAAGLAVWNGKVYAAFQGAGVYVSSDEGQSWTLSSAGLPGTGVSRVWAVGSRLFAAPPLVGLYTTADGATWTQTCAGLPGDTSVVQAAGAGDKLFLVTTAMNRAGFAVSLDGGGTCAAGAEPKASTGATDPLAYVFVP